MFHVGFHLGRQTHPGLQLFSVQLPGCGGGGVGDGGDGVGDGGDGVGDGGRGEFLVHMFQCFDGCIAAVVNNRAVPQ